MDDESAPGLLLPRGFVQPFLLNFRRDDFHVMAFFREHPLYEAVEAMISRQEGARFSVRAILTRHDQTQSDHINDAALRAAMAHAEREVTETDIEIQRSDHDGRPRIAVAFVSQAGERIVLDVIATAPPSKAGAGLTDPGDHSPDTSLPIMLRGASSLAARESKVLIDGKNHPLAEKEYAPGFKAPAAYFTEHHAMGVFRAGSELVSAPARFAPGSEWHYQCGTAVRHYKVSAISDGRLRIERSDSMREIIVARPRDDGALVLEQIELPADDGTEGLVLTFAGHSRFEIAVEGEPVISGALLRTQSGDDTQITLAPEQPAWAKRRAVHVSCSRKGPILKQETRIGLP